MQFLDQEVVPHELLIVTQFVSFRLSDLSSVAIRIFDAVILLDLSFAHCLFFLLFLPQFLLNAEKILSLRSFEPLACPFRFPLQGTDNARDYVLL